MRLKTDLLEIITNAMSNKERKKNILWSKKSCITIVLCANGYPKNYIKNKEIKNLSYVFSNENNQVFHAGTYEKNRKIFSSGGRVLNITALSKNLNNAKEQALINLNKINWSYGFFRKDIGWRLIKK